MDPLASQQETLSIWDYSIFGASLAISCAIGFYYYFAGNGQRSNKEYLLADRDMNIWVVSVSLMASFMSAITLLGVPAEIYNYGAIFFYVNLAYVLGTPISAHFFLPVFYHLRITSAYEYLELRFNRVVRIAASSVFMVQMILYMGIVLYAPAIALAAVTGFSKWAAILSVGVICALYCSFGGIKAVLWTDVFQSVLMFVSLLLVAFRGAWFVGGLATVWNHALEDGRLDMMQFSLDPTIRHSFWSLTVGGTFIYASLYGVHQTQVQRLLTSKSLGQAQLALYISWPVTSLLSFTCLLTGLVMYAFFRECDPIIAGAVDKADQLLPYFMMKVCTQIPGLPGLFIAGIFAGALSSVSSFVNSLAAVTIEDLIKPALQVKSVQLSEEKEALITKLLALFFGLLCLVITVLAEQMHGILEASLTIFGLVGGPLLGLFTLGMMSSRCSSRAALIAFSLSLCFGSWIGFGSFVAGPKPVPLSRSIEGCLDVQFNGTSTDYKSPSVSPSPLASDGVFYLYRLSYMYLAAFTFFIEILVGLALSSTCLPNKCPVDASLISPLFGGSNRSSASSDINLRHSKSHALDSHSLSSNRLKFPLSNHVHNGLSTSQIELNRLDAEPPVFRHSASVGLGN